MVQDAQVDYKSSTFGMRSALTGLMSTAQSNAIDEAMDDHRDALWRFLETKEQLIVGPIAELNDARNVVTGKLAHAEEIIDGIYQLHVTNPSKKKRSMDASYGTDVAGSSTDAMDDQDLYGVVDFRM